MKDYVLLTTGKLDANAMVENGKYPFFTCSKDPYRIDNYAFDFEAILVSGNGSQLGHINHYNGKFNAYQRTYILHDFKIYSEYIKQYLHKNLKKQIDRELSAGNIPYIKLDTINNMKTNVPNSNIEIRKVGELLSKIDLLINEKEEEIKIKKIEQKNFINVIFKTKNENFRKVKLGELYEFKNGISKEKSFFGRGTKIVNYMDVNRNIIIKSSSCTGLVECDESELHRFAVNSNDLFFTRTSETSDEIGLSCVIIDVTENCVFSGFVLRASPKRNVDSRFYAYYMRSDLARKEIIKHSSITTRALTSGSNLSSIIVNYPDIEYQKIVANILMLKDNLISVCEEEKNQLLLIKKYILNKILV